MGNEEFDIPPQKSVSNTEAYFEVSPLSACHFPSQYQHVEYQTSSTPSTTQILSHHPSTPPRQLHIPPKLLSLQTHIDIHVQRQQWYLDTVHELPHLELAELFG